MTSPCPDGLMIAGIPAIVCVYSAILGLESGEFNSFPQGFGLRLGAVEDGRFRPHSTQAAPPELGCATRRLAGLGISAGSRRIPWRIHAMDGSRWL